MGRGREKIGKELYYGRVGDSQIAPKNCYDFGYQKILHFNPIRNLEHV